MIGSSYALLALGFTLIFGTMRRLNLAYGPTIMAGAYLGTYAFARLGIGALPVALHRRRRGGARRPLRGAAVLPPVRRGCGHRLHDLELRRVDADRGGGDPAAAAAPQCLSAAGRRRARRPSGLSSSGSEHVLMLVVAGARRSGSSIGRCTTPASASACARVIDHRRAAELVGVPVRAHADAGVRAGLGRRRARRLPHRRQRRPDHADVRHVGDHQGPDRHDAGGPGLGARRHRSAAWRSASSRRTRNGCSARRCAT